MAGLGFFGGGGGGSSSNSPRKWNPYGGGGNTGGSKPPSIQGALTGGVVNGFKQFSPFSQFQAPTQTFKAPSAPTPVPMTPGGTNTTSTQANPTATQNIDTLQERAKGDMGLGRELDRGIQDIRSRGLAGIAGAQRSRVSRGLGGGGSSIDEFDAAQQGDQERMDVNRMVNDRSIAAEGMRNDLLGSNAQLALQTSGQQMQGNRDANQQGNSQQQFGLQQQQQQNQQQNEQWRMQMQAAQAEAQAQMSNFQSLLSLLG